MPVYSQERINDILELSQKIEFHGIKITVTRIFKGDNPAYQFESGQQKMGTLSGGNICCFLR